MWLHKHGWHYFHSKLKEILDDIKPDSKSIGNNNKLLLKAIATELIEHLNKIETEIQKEDNALKKLESVIYEVHLVNKTRKRIPLEQYENNLTREFERIETLYLSLKKESSALIGLCDNNNDSSDVSRSTLNEAYTLFNSLKSIAAASTSMGKYLGKILPEIEEYKEWIKKEQDSIQWAENNIKSWVTSETNNNY